ncbi:MAG: DUF1659 domain-containing protein [Clostridiaceae bacterium]|nr:DUF1659 domain-containing protein [Clostridiaceae bacterium]
MPVLTNPLNSRLQVKYSVGTDENGNSIIRTKTFSNIKASASNQDLMDVAQQLFSVQKHQVTSIIRVDENELINA